MDLQEVNILETPSKLGSHGEDIVSSQKYSIRDHSVKQGKHGSVFFVRTPRTGTNLAIKRQHIKSPANYKDRAYRELRIFEALSKLNCSHFVSIVNWYKIRDADGESPSKADLVMHYVMECADTTLADVKQLLGRDMIEVVFQLLYALDMAQKALEFNHNDLHLRNVLLTKIEKPLLLSKDSRTWQANHYEVKICDFGLSRIKIDGEVIFNSVDIFSEMYDPGSDVRKLAAEFSKIKLEWSDKDEELKSRFTDLKKKMSKGTPPSVLLQHPIFDTLIVTLPKLEETVKKEEEESNEEKVEKQKVEIKLEFPEEDKENLGENQKLMKDLSSINISKPSKAKAKSTGLKARKTTKK